jgi:hypothetical protein
MTARVRSAFAGPAEGDDRGLPVYTEPQAEREIAVAEALVQADLAARFSIQLALLVFGPSCF